MKIKLILLLYVLVVAFGCSNEKYEKMSVPSELFENEIEITLGDNIGKYKDTLTYHDSFDGYYYILEGQRYFDDVYVYTEKSMIEGFSPVKFFPYLEKRKITEIILLKSVEVGTEESVLKEIVDLCYNFFGENAEIREGPRYLRNGIPYETIKWNIRDTITIELSYLPISEVEKNQSYFTENEIDIEITIDFTYNEME